MASSQLNSIEFDKPGWLHQNYKTQHSKFKHNTRQHKQNTQNKTLQTKIDLSEVNMKPALVSLC